MDPLARKLRALQATFFRAAPPTLQAELVRSALFDTIAPSTSLCTFGAPAERIWIVSNAGGAAHSLIAEHLPFEDATSPESKHTYCLAFLIAGDVVGLDAFWSSPDGHSRYAACATAQHTSEVLALSLSSVEQALREHPILLSAWMSYARERAQRLHARLHVQSKPGLQRLATLLVMLAKSPAAYLGYPPSVEKRSSPVLMVPRPFGAMAAGYLRESRTSLQRDLLILAKRGAIEVSPEPARFHGSDDAVIIRDLALLEGIAAESPSSSKKDPASE